MQYKILKKIINFFGFKLMEKNLIKNIRLISQNDYLNTNHFLRKIFEHIKIKSIIQIGANDGIRFDVLNFYIKKYKPKALLVEPILSNFRDLKNNYKEHKNIFFENSAISVNNEISYLFKVKENKISKYDTHIKGITSFNKNHLKKHGVKERDITLEKINSISIRDLLLKYKFKEIDLIYVDAEGYDGKIILDFLKKYKSNPILIFEFIHIDNSTLTKVLNIIIKKKYIYFKSEENIFCIPKRLNGLKKLF